MQTTCAALCRKVNCYSNSAVIFVLNSAMLLCMCMHALKPGWIVRIMWGLRHWCKNKINKADHDPLSSPLTGAAGGRGNGLLRLHLNWSGFWLSSLI